MDRAKRLTSLWSYLPVFRVVAETEHLTLAAKMLSLTPSAVSRSVSALEADLDQPLFDRRGRTMKLNEAGRHLLLGIRQSMRVVDESLVAMSGGALVAKVRVATAEPFSSLYVPLLVTALRTSHAALALSFARVAEESVSEALLDGRIDVAFTHRFVPRPQLRGLRLRSLSTSAYVAAGHPLARASRLNKQALAGVTYVRVGPEGNAHAETWAAELGLSPAVEVDDFDLASRIVMATDGVGVLPDALVAHDVAAGRLVGLDGLRPPEVALFGVARSPLQRPGPADVVLDEAKRVTSGEPHGR